MRRFTDNDYYRLFEQKETDFPDIVFMGVLSTGIFCRIGCPARLPKRENCTFHESAEAALKAGFRACKRCHPTQQPGEATSLVKQLVTLVEDDPERRWKETDLKSLGVDPSTARRQFKARFNMTFSAYARSRRLGIAQKTLKAGDKVINAQLSAGYDSPSGFREAFAKTFGVSPKGSNADPLLIDWIDTPLGPMIAICDDTGLYLLEFTDRKNLQRQMERLSKRQKRAIIPGRTSITDQIAAELSAYFDGKLTDFKTPIIMSGTAFQKKVWAALCTIPMGQSWSYSDLAKKIGNDKAVRAVASSNANNGLALIVPCHRVIAKDGGLGGYAGGLKRKDWLLAHEKKVVATR